MKDWQKLVLLGGGTAVVIGLIAANKAKPPQPPVSEPILDQEQSTLQYNTVLWMGQGQTFTTGPATQWIPRIEVPMAKAGNPGSIGLVLYDNVSKNIRLGNAIVQPEDVAYDFTWIPFVFTPAVYVYPNTQYYFELAGPGEVQENTYKVGFSGANPYPHGARYSLDSYGAPFLTQDGLTDLMFRTFRL